MSLESTLRSMIAVFGLLLLFTVSGESATADAPAAATPGFTLSERQLDFGTQTVDSASGSLSFTINAPSGGSAVVKVSSKSDAFTPNPADCTLNTAKPSCSVAVSFKPSRAGPASDAIVVTDASGATQSVALTGTAVTCGLGNICLGKFRILGMLSVVIVYWLALVAVRWNMVASPTRTLLLSQIKALKGQSAVLAAQAPPPPATQPAQIDALLNYASELVSLAAKTKIAASLEILFWSRGNEISGWTCVHEAEGQLAALLSADQLRVQLERAAIDLAELKDSSPLDLAARINASLAANPITASSVTPPTLAPTVTERWKSLLADARGLLYDRSDTSFAALVAWQNKTMWLVGIGLLFIVALAMALQHEILFLLGATGGLLSRLSRALNRANVPTDYGASWTTLFLSPVTGALSGWCGILKKKKKKKKKK